MRWVPRMLHRRYTIFDMIMNVLRIITFEIWRPIKFM
jgi:hypothetical protein